MYLFWNSEIYRLEVDILNLWIYVKTQRYIRSRFPKSIISFQTLSFYTSSILHFRKSINKVLLKCKQSTFLFFVFILHLYFLGSSLKAYFYCIYFKDLKYKWSILKVYLTSHIVFSAGDTYIYSLIINLLALYGTGFGTSNNCGMWSNWVRQNRKTVKNMIRILLKRGFN